MDGAGLGHAQHDGLGETLHRGGADPDDPLAGTLHGPGGKAGAVLGVEEELGYVGVRGVGVEGEVEPGRAGSPERTDPGDGDELRSGDVAVGRLLDVGFAAGVGHRSGEHHETTGVGHAGRVDVEVDGDGVGVLVGGGHVPARVE